jgi:hypothetical protein
MVMVVLVKIPDFRRRHHRVETDARRVCAPARVSPRPQRGLPGLIYIKLASICG